MQLFSYILFLIFVNIFRIIPFRLLYIISDFVAFLLRKVVKYRYKVVYSNISKVFTGMSEKEKQALIRKFYRHLADITLEAIKGFSMSKSTVIERHKIINPEILDEYYAKGYHVIGVTGHYGNWEWGSLSGGLQMKYPLVGFYKPLSNKYMDSYLFKSRARFGTILASITKTYFTFEKNKVEPTAYIMVADQNPGRRSRAIWVNFLGIETAFLHGPEKYANMYNHAVAYIGIERVKRGYYTLLVEPLAEPGQYPENGVITSIFAAKLEEKIKKTPESWLWTHKRWKYDRPQQTDSQSSV